MKKIISKNERLKRLSFLYQRPDAEAQIQGNPSYPRLVGVVRFYQTPKGVLVEAEISGLPQNGIFAFHIHEGRNCKSNNDGDFPNAGQHYNPNENKHPYHSGDMPPLFGNAGVAFMIFLTNRFRVAEIVGRVVIIHAGVDDFSTQPAGNAGKKIACGVIENI